MKNLFWSRLTSVIVAALFLCLLVVPGRQAEAKKPFRISFAVWLGFAPLFLARDKGYFGDLPVELSFLDLEGDRRAALYSGRAQMICETIDMFETNRTNADYPGKIVFAIDESHGGDGVVAVKEIKTVKDLKGRTAASESGEPAQFMLEVALRKYGMTLKDLKLQEMTSPDASAAFMSGGVDVAGVYEPYMSKALEKRAGAHILLSSRDFPGLITDVGIAGDQSMQERRDDVRQVYMGWAKALDYFRTNRKDAVAIMAKHFKLSPQEFEKTLSGLRYYGQDRNRVLFGTRAKQGPIFKIFKTNGEVLRVNGLTQALASPQSKIDPGIVALPVK